MCVAPLPCRLAEQALELAAEVRCVGIAAVHRE